MIAATGVGVLADLEVPRDKVPLPHRGWPADWGPENTESQPSIEWISRKVLLKTGYTVADFGPLAECKEFAVIPLMPETEDDETGLALGSAKIVRAALNLIKASGEAMDIRELFPVVVPFH